MRTTMHRGIRFCLFKFLLYTAIAIPTLLLTVDLNTFFHAPRNYARQVPESATLLSTQVCTHVALPSTAAWETSAPPRR